MCARCRCNTPASKLRWFGGCGAGALLLSSVALVIATFVRDALADFVNQQLIDNFILSSPASGQVGRQMKIGHRIDTVKKIGALYLCLSRLSTPVLSTATSLGRYRLLSTYTTSRIPRTWWRDERSQRCRKSDLWSTREMPEIPRQASHELLRSPSCSSTQL